MIRTCITILLTLITRLVHAAEYPIQPSIALLPVGTNLSLLVKPVHTTQHNAIIDYRSEQFMIPASTQKVITALAALLELGDEFRFVTSMKTDGSIKDNQLNGDLIIQLSGDPTLTRQQLNKMLSALRAKGIHKINGDVILDTSIFASHDLAPGWSWNNLTACYNTAPAAAIVDGNCFYAGLTPASKVGQTVAVSVSPIYPVNVTSTVTTIAKLEADDATVNDRYCELDIQHKGNNHYQLTGCMQQNDNKKKYFHFAVLDSVDYFTGILKSLLAQQKITVTGKFIENAQGVTKKLTLLTTNQSEPLPILLTDMLKKSDNMIADTLFRHLGHHRFSVAGTWRNGGDAVKIILKEKANIDLNNSVLSDGSGLSRTNLLSAEKMMEVLQYIAVNDKKLHLIDMLPIAGRDGTLQYRTSLSKPPFKDTILAKTGYLDGTYNLVGYIKNDNEQYTAFVQFISGYNHISEEKQQANQAIMLFEETFYSNLFN